MIHETVLKIFIFCLFPTLGFAQGASFGTAFWNDRTTTSFSLSHVPNLRNFTVSWPGGSGNGGANGCKLQFQRNGTIWTDIAGTYNCDVLANNLSATLPPDNWTNNFNATGVAIRLARVSDGAVVGTFHQKVTCLPVAGSASPTPNRDENCNSLWDDTAGSPAGYIEVTFPNVFQPPFTSLPQTVTCPSAASVGGGAVALTYFSVSPVYKPGDRIEVFNDDSCASPSINFLGDNWLQIYNYRNFGSGIPGQYTETINYLSNWGGYINGLYRALIDISNSSCVSDGSAKMIARYFQSNCPSGPARPPITGSIRFAMSPPTEYRASCYYSTNSTLTYN